MLVFAYVASFPQWGHIARNGSGNFSTDFRIGLTPTESETALRTPNK